MTPWTAPGWANEAYRTGHNKIPIQTLLAFVKIAEHHGFSAHGKASFDFIYMQALAGNDWAQKIIDRVTPKIVKTRMLK